MTFRISAQAVRKLVTVPIVRIPQFVAPAVICLGLAACSGDSNPKTVDPTSQSSSVEGGSDAALTSDEARAALLTVSDLPAGYAKDGKDGDGSPTNYICDYKPDTEQVAGADRSFNRDDIEFAGTAIRVFVDEDEAIASFKQFEEVLDSDCAEGEADGEKYTFGAMSVPKFGDNSIGMRLDLESGGSVAYIYVQRGPIFMSVSGGGYSPMSIDDLQPLAEKQLAKVDAALGESKPG